MKSPLRSAFALLLLAAWIPAATAADDWDEMATILKRIVPPTFPARDFPVGDFGAVGDGKTNCHPAFVKAIDACTKVGGGRVVVPAGTFLCNGPINLKSNVNLHIGEGATILFGAEAAYYLPVVLTRFEGTMFYGHSPRIYAKDQTNIAITGKGTIDGNARGTFPLMPPFKSFDGSTELRQMGAAGVPVEQRIFGEGRWLRPSMIQPFGCTNVLIEGVTLKDSTFWVVHPVLCRNVTVRGLTVDTMNPNNDGCDPDSCTDVLIERCNFHTGDDSIAIKSGRDQDGWRVGQASENIVIRHCIFGSRHSGLCLGSEMSGGVRNIFVEDCHVDSVSSAFYFKSNLDRGGVVEHVRARRIDADEVREGFVRFETGYHGWRGENHPPTFRHFVLEDLTCKRATAYGIYVEGVEGAPITGVVVRRATIDSAQVPFWLRRADGVRLEAVKINGVVQPAQPPPTPAGETKLKISA